MWFHVFTKLRKLNKFMGVQNYSVIHIINNMSTSNKNMHIRGGF